MKDVFLYQMENMDLYHDFAEKLDAAKKSVDIDESLRYSFEGQNEITNELRAIDNKTFYKNIQTFYFALGLVLFFIHIVFLGLWAGLLGLVLLAFFFISRKILLTKARKMVSKYRREADEGGLLHREIVEKLKQHNLFISDLKLTRVRLTQLFAVVLTPVLFVSAYELIFSKISILILGIAILLGSFFWMVYFHGNIEEVKRIREKTLTT